MSSSSSSTPSASKTVSASSSTTSLTAYEQGGWTPSSQGRFLGKVVLVTGASQGLGRDLAIAFASEGAFVVVCARRELEGQETVRLALATAHRHIKLPSTATAAVTFYCTDVTRGTQVEMLIANTVKLYGKLDIAINNGTKIMQIKNTLYSLSLSHTHTSFLTHTRTSFCCFILSFRFLLLLCFVCRFLFFLLSFLRFLLFHI